TKDPNNQINNQVTSYLYDSSGRVIEVDYPDGGQKIITHQESSFPFSATLTTKINASLSLVATDVFDGLGRISQSQLSSDPEGATYVETVYDGLGRKAVVANPHRSTTASTDGTTYYLYDALGRSCLTVPPDFTGSIPSGCPTVPVAGATRTVYNGNLSTV